MSQIFVQGYTFLRILGEGGFGRVYLARHDQTGEQVALKVIQPEIAADQDSIRQFLREMANTKALNHPNIVHMRDFGYYDNIFFLTLEYCNGGSLEDLISQRGGKLPIDEALPIILQVLDGLEYAHKAEISHVKLADGNFGRAQGLVHRDLNPRNIFFAKTNGICIAKIGDYGLAKAFDLAGLSGQTTSGDYSAGTPFFMPQQQVINFKYAKPEVDIWAAAACLYYMLTGKCPRNFISNDHWEEVLNTQAVPIRERDPSIPDKLAELIDSALVDEPEIYFKNATDFKHELLKTLPLV